MTTNMNRFTYKRDILNIYEDKQNHKRTLFTLFHTLKNENELSFVFKRRSVGSIPVRET